MRWAGVDSSELERNAAGQVMLGASWLGPERFGRLGEVETGSAWRRKAWQERRGTVFDWS